MALTTNGGRSDGDGAATARSRRRAARSRTRRARATRTPRFIAPFSAGPDEPDDHWVAGGQFVWDDQGRVGTPRAARRRCDWKIVHDTGAGPLDHRGRRDRRDAPTPAGAGRATPRPSSPGIDTNAGGTWHTVAAAEPPEPVRERAHRGPRRRRARLRGLQRVLATLDERRAASAMSSSRATPAPHATDISAATCPTSPGDDLVLSQRHSWWPRTRRLYGRPPAAACRRAGRGSSTGLPNSSVNDLR